MACRLARFNAGVDFNANASTRSFFMGVPAPAGAMLVVLPLVCSFHFKIPFDNPTFTIPSTLFVSFMLVSRIPTFSSKMINASNLAQLGPLKIPILFVIFGTGFGTLFLYPWLSVVIISVLYIISFPLSYVAFIVLSKKQT